MLAALKVVQRLLIRAKWELVQVDAALDLAKVTRLGTDNLGDIHVGDGFRVLGYFNIRELLPHNVLTVFLLYLYLILPVGLARP